MLSFFDKMVLAIVTVKLFDLVKNKLRAWSFFMIDIVIHDLQDAQNPNSEVSGHLAMFPQKSLCAIVIHKDSYLLFTHVKSCRVLCF